LTKTTTDRAAALAAALLCAAAARAFAADPTPVSPGGRPVEYEATESLFGHAGPFEPVAEADERWQYGGQRLYRAGTFGSYARVERHLKLGAFYRLQYGVRHDDDWVNNPAGKWVWADPTSRPESVLVLDATPRTSLPFLGEGWTLSLKLRDEHNFYNRQNSLLLAPELAWFWMDGLNPRATIFFRYEAWLPLNWGETRVYERWWYLAGLWHAAPWLSVGPSVALRDETWSASSQYRSANPGADYKVLYRSWVPGLTVVARLR
jgi:hypothetical protein